MRTAWLLKLSQFEKRAGLTPEEKERVLAALADTQQQAVLSMDLLKDTLRDPSVRVERVDELERSLREGLLQELRSFLDPSQVLEFRRKAGLTRGLALALFEPLDIEYRDR